MAKLLYFGRLSDLTGRGHEIIDLPANIFSTTDLRNWLDEAHHGDGALLDSSVRLAINDEIAHEPASISNDDEIAFMPPVGGG